MSAAASTVNGRENAYWWQGGLYLMKARAEDTGGALGLVDATLYRGFGPPLHVHNREDEAFYVIEGEVRFRQGTEDFVGGPGSWVWGPRGVPHTFKVESERARALILVTPAAALLSPALRLFTRRPGLPTVFRRADSRGHATRSRSRR
jgi:quercetin dioxygenase-like cupin family protein